MPRDLRRRVLEIETIQAAYRAVWAAEEHVQWPCLAPGCYVECLNEDNVHFHRALNHDRLAFIQLHGTLSL